LDGMVNKKAKKCVQPERKKDYIHPALRADETTMLSKPGQVVTHWPSTTTPVIKKALLFAKHNEPVPDCQVGELPDNGALRYTRAWLIFFLKKNVWCVPRVGGLHQRKV
jgi:hypothetical protein